ncbi:aspartate aminotransferase family protein [Nocardiopsis sp. YSL2]|uniref:aminotransferase family protein n=1 Tax=Nocardiopsis sp. YSL2 TaxID=2939492 RepID=UPI0026F47BA0|nr:aminotransferase class III-fold pyridoxal phosphate-dependent enzyme [Nocardiopsis sp. YSL2]
MSRAPSPQANHGSDTWLERDRAHLWHPWAPNRISSETLVIVSGEGCRVWDADGRGFLDAKASGLNATLGYGCRPVIDAVSDQLSRLMTYDMIEGTSVPAIELARRIAGLTGPELNRTFFCNSGSEAIEACVRIARSYHTLSGSSERTQVVSLRNGYHGTTMAAFAATTGAAPEAGFVSLPGPVPPAAPGMGDRGGLDVIRDHLGEHGRRTAAVLLEPVQGLGGHIVPDEYLWELRKLCDEHGVLMILDEVMTGFGRTGRMFAYEYADIRPDILATSKGLTAGYASLGAVTTTQRVFDAFEHDRDVGGLAHGHTHSGHATACATALAVLDQLEGAGVLANTQERGRQLLEGLGAGGVGDTAFVRDLRGRGLLVVVELDSPRRAVRVKQSMQQDGVLVRRSGANIILAPPLVITAEEVDRVTEAVVAALNSDYVLAI